MALATPGAASRMGHRGGHAWIKIRPVAGASRPGQVMGCLTAGAIAGGEGRQFSTQPMAGPEFLVSASRFFFIYLAGFLANVTISLASSGAENQKELAQLIASGGSEPMTLKGNIGIPLEREAGRVTHMLVITCDPNARFHVSSRVVESTKSDKVTSTRFDYVTLGDDNSLRVTDYNGDFRQVDCKRE
jgi:hypothetical protein